MGKIKVIITFCVFALLMSTGWQIANCEFHNYLLNDDLKNLAALNGPRIGIVAAPQSEGQLRSAVIRKAREHEIYLSPDQILVRRSGSTENPIVFLAAKYQARVWMPGFALVFHFTATSRA